MPEATVAPIHVPAAPASPMATIIDDSVSLRSGPNTNTAIIVSWPTSTQVDVIGKQNDWTQVRLRMAAKAGSSVGF